ncbi:hypothetical protein FP2506_05556 [Fulvimarina pelagi HTCC2506]|uniref:Uncharacterized protein n=1 Tax=Fulvimarina pelagi HTCC2506 TaxID=314231 RepID=Q0G7T5_9HYPH|nr:hypothetical protein FP2506_05556 [Fulvimarina pelagi HTCC2506]
MIKTHAAFATSLKRGLVLSLCLIGLAVQPATADWKAPWKDSDRALVIDAYEFNPIDWEKMTSDERIAGFINKASDGMPPKYRCGSGRDDVWKLCKNRWWKYSVTKELYMTRRQIADSLGLLWGAYHLARPGNPRAQADHFIDFAEPRENDLIALDIEDLSDEFMSLEDAEIFAEQVKIRTGRYPVLYTNGNTAKHISKHREDYPLLSRLPLWYARYTGDITGKFPEETWPRYALWQFSSMHNCNNRSCPYRVDGTKNDIDVNVSHLDIAGLKAAWPFNDLLPEHKPETDPAMLIASVDEETEEQVADALSRPAADGGEEDAMVAAYGPMGDRPKRVDPLKLLNKAATKGEKHAESRVEAHLDEVEDIKEAAKPKEALQTAVEISGDLAPGMPVPTPNPLRAEAPQEASGEAIETDAVSQNEAGDAASDEQALLDEKDNSADEVVAVVDETVVAPLPLTAKPKVSKAAKALASLAKASNSAEMVSASEEESDDPSKALAPFTVLTRADGRIASAFSLTN